MKVGISKIDRTIPYFVIRICRFVEETDLHEDCRNDCFFLSISAARRFKKIRFYKFRLVLWRNICFPKIPKKVGRSYGEPRVYQNFEKLRYDCHVSLDVLMTHHIRRIASWTCLRDPINTRFYNLRVDFEQIMWNSKVMAVSQF